jgi:Flp pilus assembly protein TadG
MRRTEARATHQAGQSLVEATLVLLVFFGLLLGVIDCGEVLYAHEALVDRARSAVRWGALHKWQGPEPIVNLVLYDATEEPSRTTPGYLGMTPSNVQVRYQPATAEHPDDEILTVSIVNFESHFISPWATKVLISPRPVMIAAPMSLKTE